MKQIVLMMLMMGGAVVGSQAQTKPVANAYEKGYRVHAGGRWDDCNKSYRGAYYDCRPGTKVVPAPVAAPAGTPAPAPAVAATPAPAPAVLYAQKPKVAAGGSLSL